VSALTIDPAVVEALLARLYLGGGAPRNEERKKAHEVVGLLALLHGAVKQPVPRGTARVLVDAAAGHGYVGLCAAALLGWRHVVVIERDPDRVERVQAAAAKLDVQLQLVVRTATLAIDAPTPIPMQADVVIALHACGPATDGVLAAATSAHARWILCAPCCYGAAVPGWHEAHAKADALALPHDAQVRGRFCASLIDGGRLDRLHAEGYEAQLVAFTAPSVTPHHLAFRARRGGVVEIRR